MEVGCMFCLFLLFMHAISGFLAMLNFCATGHYDDCTAMVVFVAWPLYDGKFLKEIFKRSAAYDHSSRKL